MASSELIISFPDQSHSFVHGAEYGRLLCMIEMGLPVVKNNGFPVHKKNVILLRATCESYGYIPNFSAVEGMDEWVNFFAVKSGQVNN